MCSAHPQIVALLQSLRQPLLNSRCSATTVAPRSRMKMKPYIYISISQLHIFVSYRTAKPHPTKQKESNLKPFKLKHIPRQRKPNQRSIYTYNKYKNCRSELRQRTFDSHCYFIYRNIYSQQLNREIYPNVCALPKMFSISVRVCVQFVSQMLSSIT